MNYQKSTLSAFSQINQTVSANTPLTFANSEKTGCSIQFTSGGTSISLIKPGLYYVEFSASGTTSSSSGNIALQLFKNGNPISGALAFANSTSTTDAENLSFGKIIQVNPCCPSNNSPTVLTVVNTGVGAIYSTASINVFKLA